VADRRRVHITTDCTADAVVSGDRRELTRVVANLLANAVRSSPDDSSVTVDVTGSGTVVVATVADQCGGIPADALPRLFEPGWRGTSSRSPDESTGAGLGLAIVRGLVDAHGGDVAVRTSRTGCQFVVTLPAAGSAGTA
jgi:signal transduction histidine kinase